MESNNERLFWVIDGSDYGCAVIATSDTEARAKARVELGWSDDPDLREESMVVTDSSTDEQLAYWHDFVRRAVAAERAAHADEVRALKEQMAAVYGGLNHATEHGLKSCAQAAADERDAALAIVDAEIARIVGVNGGVEPPELSVMAWRLTSLRTVRDGIAARGGAK